MKRFWTTKDGKKIRFKDLTNTHLINIYKMIARQHARCIDNAWRLSSMLTGDIALDCIEQDIENLEEMDDYEYVEAACPEITREIETRELLEEIR